MSLLPRLASGRAAAQRGPACVRQRPRHGGRPQLRGGLRALLPRDGDNGVLHVAG